MYTWVKIDYVAPRWIAAYWLRGDNVNLGGIGLDAGTKTWTVFNYGGRDNYRTEGFETEQAAKAALVLMVGNCDG